MTARFAQIPEIPDELPAGLAEVLSAMRTNLNALTGQIGTDRRAEAIHFGDVTVADVTQTSAAAAGATPTQAEFDAAVADIEALARAHNYLAAQLRGEEVGS